MDLAFAFDGSDSLTEEEFENLKLFATSVVESYNISPLDTHVAVLEFSNRPRIISTLSNGASASQVISAIRNTSPSRGMNSVTSEALEEAARNVFSPQAGGRTGVPKTLILITHSRSSSSVPVSQAVQRLRAAGIRVYVVGVGTRVDMQELKGIAAGDSALYPVQRPSGVPGIADDVVRTINQDIKRSEYLTKLMLPSKSFDHSITAKIYINVFLLS